jgi:hypothetical protein
MIYFATTFLGCKKSAMKAIIAAKKLADAGSQPLEFQLSRFSVSHGPSCPELNREL